MRSPLARALPSEALAADIAGAPAHVANATGPDGGAAPAAAAAAAAAAPLAARQASHLKRPGGLALEVMCAPPPHPEAPSDQPGAKAAAAGARGAEKPPSEGGSLEMAASAISPLLASSLGIAPASLRHFLKIDDLTSDLLSPLGSVAREAGVGGW